MALSEAEELELLELEEQEAMALGQVQQPQEQGFFDRVGSDYQQRAKSYGDIEQEYISGNQSLPETAVQLTGQAAGFVNDVAGEGLKSLGHGISSVTPDFIEQPIRQAGRYVFDRVADSAVGDLARSAVQGYQGFAKEHPRAARNIEAATNIGGLVGAATPIKGTSLIDTAASTAGKGAKAVAKTAAAPIVSGTKAVAKGTKTAWHGAFARTAEDLEEVSGTLKKNASNLYNKSREAGAVISAERSTKLVDDIERAVAGSGKMNARLHGDTLSVLDDLRKAQQAGEIGLEELDQYRQLLNDVVNKNTDAIKGANPDAFKASIAIDKLDDAVEKLSPQDIVSGDASAIGLLQQGREEWKKFRKFQAVSNIIKQADGDPNRLKAAMQRFVNKPKNLRGFSEKERQALRAAAKNTAPEKLLKAFGKFGFDLGSSMTAGNTALPALTIGGGIVAGGSTAPLVITGTIARQLQKALGRGKAEEVLKIIQQGGTQ